MLVCLAVPALSTVYAATLIGSLALLCLIVGVRLLLQQRFVRRFVRSVKQRMLAVEERGASLHAETVIARPPKNPRTSAIELQQVRSLLRDAEKALAQQKTDEAERILIQALTVQPQAIEARAELAKLYLVSDRENKAEAMYRELLQLRDDISFHSNLGLAYYKQQKYVEACQAYQEALNRDAKNPERCAALGRACIAARRFEEAAPLLEKATQFLSRDTELLHLLAECYLQLGRSEQAEETYRRINKMEPYNADVKAKLATINGAARG